MRAVTKFEKPLGTY